MGCDIHTIAEIKMNGQWLACRYELANDYRNYDSFAILADVRNYHNWSPICSPRGFPAGYDEDKFKNICCFDGDRASWLLLSEIEAYISKLPTKHTISGVLEKEVYCDLVAHDLQPHTWSNGASGPNIKVLTDKDIVFVEGKRKVDVGATTLNNGEWSHAKTSWAREVKKCIPYLFDVIDEMNHIKKHCGLTSENIRLVFCFDN